MEKIMNAWLDSTVITSQVFFVRKAAQPLADSRLVYNGMIPVSEKVALGYRYYQSPHRDAPVILMFHGNGEIVTDYDTLAPFYHVAGAGLIVVDYRGYGWSDGVPLVTQMLPDALKVVDALPGILQQHGTFDARLFVKGRSLGSAPAIYAVQQRPKVFNGLIIESGFSDAPSVFRQLGNSLRPLLPHDDALPLYNARKLHHIHTPLLILHGQRDTVVPATHAQDLYNASPSSDKTLTIIEKAGHNDMLIVNPARYFDAIRQFLQKHT